MFAVTLVSPLGHNGEQLFRLKICVVVQKARHVGECRLSIFKCAIEPTVISLALAKPAAEGFGDASAGASHFCGE